jgi:hypothetical protein
MINGVSSKHVQRIAEDLLEERLVYKDPNYRCRSVEWLGTRTTGLFTFQFLNRKREIKHPKNTAPEQPVQ